MIRLLHILALVLLLGHPCVVTAGPLEDKFCKLNMRDLADRYVLSTREHTLERDYEERIQDFFNAVPVQVFKGAGSVPLKFRVFPAQGNEDRGSIVVAHGYTESARKWAETIYNLTENGYRVYIFDYRGHGESERLTPNRFMVYTDSFGDYVEDLARFTDLVVSKDSTRQLNLLGYSMGGLVSAMYTAENPGVFKTVSLAAPMMGVKLRGVPVVFVEWAAKLFKKMGYGKRYALGQGEKWLELEPLGLHVSSPARYQLQARLVEESPETQVGGASFGWVATAMEAVRQRKRIAEAAKDETLVIIGSLDKVIPQKDIVKYCLRHNNCRVHVVPGRHGLFNEADSVRDSVLLPVLDHFDPASPERGDLALPRVQSEGSAQ